MVFINKHPKLSCCMASMPINDTRLIKQVMLIFFAVLSSRSRGLILYIFQTTTTLLAALSVGVKKNLQWKSWIPFFKCIKMNLCLDGRRSKLLQQNEILP